MVSNAINFDCFEISRQTFAQMQLTWLGAVNLNLWHVIYTL